MTLEQFNGQYKYKTDKDKFGFFEVWDIPKLQDDGFYYGDCEDYCLTLQAKVEGYKDIELYYCHYNGQGHCIGNINGKWIDCILQREVETLPPLYTDVRKYWLVEIWSKKLCGKVFKWLNKYLKK